MDKKYHHILGIGTPLLDHLLPVSEVYLNTLPGKKHGMEPVDYPSLISIIEKSGSIPKQKAGGSCANTIKGLAALGWDCALTGKSGKDPVSEKVSEDLLQNSVQPYLCTSNTPTSHVLCLITPDGKRTCRAFLGAGGEMTPDDLDPQLFKHTKLVHIEGYSLLCPGLTHRAMELAKQAGAKISFDLGSFELVENYKDLILQLFTEFVDVLFSNEDEILALTGLDPKDGCRSLSNLGKISVVMMGKEGCWAGLGNYQVQCPAYPVDPIDTTGAGDLFASGFLHGFLKQKTLEECARYGAITGGSVVQVVGAEIPLNRWPVIRKRISDLQGP